MTRPVITVLLGDPRLPDRSKPGGRFTTDDLDQVVRLKSALGELTDYQFEYLNDHERLLDDLRRQPPELILNFCDIGFRNEATLELHVASYLEMLGIACKRLQRWVEMQAHFERLLEEFPGDMTAVVELAKHFEHRARNLARAKLLCQGALEHFGEADPPEARALQHRLDRILRKLSAHQE